MARKYVVTPEGARKLAKARSRGGKVTAKINRAMSQGSHQIRINTEAKNLLDAERAKLPPPAQAGLASRVIIGALRGRHPRA